MYKLQANKDNMSNLLKKMNTCQIIGHKVDIKPNMSILDKKNGHVKGKEISNSTCALVTSSSLSWAPLRLQKK